MPQAVTAIVAGLKLIGGGTLVNGAVVGGSAWLGAFQVGLAVATQFLGAKQKKQGATARRDQTLMVRESAHPRREIYGRARVGGIWFYAQTEGANNDTLTLVLGVADGEIDAVETIMFGEKPIQIKDGWEIVGEYDGAGEVAVRTGSPTDTTPGQLASYVDGWTDAPRLRGIAYVVLRLTHSTTLFPNGLPEISFIVRGRADIYDPRTQTTGYTANPALCLNHFLTTSAWGAGADYATEIDEAALIAAANICDETTNTLTGTEPRYSANGTLTADNSIEDNMGLLRQCMAGEIVYTGGRFKIAAGAYSPPSFHITSDHILNVEKHTTKKPRRDRVNTINGLYMSEFNKWQESDFPTISNAAYIAADGDELPRDLELPLVQSPALAQRLAKIELETARLERTLEIECSLRVLPVVAGSVVTLTFPRYGYAAAVFQCIASEIRPGSSTAPPTIKLSLREWHPGVYAWDYTTEEHPANPAADIPGNGNTLPGTNYKITEQKFSGDDLIFNDAPTSSNNYIPLFNEPAGFVRYKIELTTTETGAKLYYKLTYDNYGSALLDSANGTKYTGALYVSTFRSFYIQTIQIKDGKEAKIQKLRAVTN